MAEDDPEQTFQCIMVLPKAHSREWIVALGISTDGSFKAPNRAALRTPHANTRQKPSTWPKAVVPPKLGSGATLMAVRGGSYWHRAPGEGEGESPYETKLRAGGAAEVRTL